MSARTSSGTISGASRSIAAVILPVEARAFRTVGLLPWGELPLNRDSRPHRRWEAAAIGATRRVTTGVTGPTAAIPATNSQEVPSRTFPRHRFWTCRSRRAETFCFRFASLRGQMAAPMDTLIRHRRFSAPASAGPRRYGHSRVRSVSAGHAADYLRIDRSRERHLPQAGRDASGLRRGARVATTIGSSEADAAAFVQQVLAARSIQNATVVFQPRSMPVHRPARK